MFKRQYVSTLYDDPRADPGDFQRYRVELRIHEDDVRVFAHFCWNFAPQRRACDIVIIVLILQLVYQGFRCAYCCRRTLEMIVSLNL